MKELREANKGIFNFGWLSPAGKQMGPVGAGVCLTGSAIWLIYMGMPIQYFPLPPRLLSVVLGAGYFIVLWVMQTQSIFNLVVTGR